MVKRLLVALALSVLAAPASAGQLDFRLFGSSGDEAHWWPPQTASPLNPGNFLDLQERTNSLDLTGFGELTTADRSQKLHAKLRASLESAGGSNARLDVGELYWHGSVGSSVDFTIGRKIERWGTGYAWNPTGFINPRKNPADPNDRLSANVGVDLAQLGLVVHDWSISLIGLPQINWRDFHVDAAHTAWAARAYRLVNGTDVSVVAESGADGTREGVSLSRVFGKAFECHGEIAWFQREDRTTLAADGLVTSREDAVQGLVGGQYTFARDVNLAIEYFHNGKGLDGSEWGRFRVAAAAARQAFDAGQPLPLLAANRSYTELLMGRDYGFTRLFVPIDAGRVEVEALSIANLRDGSTLVRGGVTWKVRPNLRVYWIQTEFADRPGSEFSYLRVRRLADIGFRIYY
jgi:hypothetical protein